MGKGGRCWVGMGGEGGGGGRWDLVTRSPTQSATGLMQVRETVALRRSTFRVLPDGPSGASRHCTPLSPQHCSRSASASERRPGKRGPGLCSYLHQQPEQQRRHPPGQTAHGSVSSPGVPCYRVAGASQQHGPRGAGTRAGGGGSDPGPAGVGGAGRLAGGCGA